MSLNPLSRRVSIFLFGAIVLIGVSVFIGLWVNSFRGDRDFRVVLLQTDLALGDGNYSRAQELIDGLITRVTSPQDGLRLVKRGFRLFDETGDYTRLGSITLALIEKYPGNEDIRGYRTSFLLESGNIVGAAQTAGGLTSSSWLPYKIEAYLKARIPLDQTLTNLRLPGVALPLGPQDYSDPNSFLQSWTITRDIRYLKNAALLLAATGQVDSAMELLESQRTRLQSFDELLFYSLLSFDSRGGEEGISFLAALEPEFDDRQDLYRLLAEFQMESGEMESASGSLMTLLQSSEASPQDFINASRFFRFEGKWPEAEGILIEGIGRFPDDSLLKYAHLATQREMASSEVFQDTFSLYASGIPRDPWLRLFGILLEAEERGYSEVVPQLWQLTQDSPEFDPGWRNLLWILWMTDDRQAFDEALKELDPQESPWLRQYETLKLLRDRQPVAALQTAALLPPRGSLGMYSVAGVRIGLDTFDSPEAQRLFELGLEQGLGYLETPDSVREYLMYLGSWLAILQGKPEESFLWYSRLTENFPRSVYSTRLRYWTGSER